MQREASGPDPLRVRGMTDTRRQSEHDGRDRPVGDDPDEIPTDLLSSYTPKQREAFLKGFRILAQVAIRAHIEQQAKDPGKDAG